MIPNCTVVTSFYKKNIDSSISQDIYIKKIDLLLNLPVYLVFFTEIEFVEIFKLKRKEYGFSDITLIIERKFEGLLKQNNINSESHILSCSKFDFVLNTIDFNPFNTRKFSWLDAFICEKYSHEIILNILNYNNSEKFYIQISDVIDKKFKLIENKKEYYSSYKNVVCGELFTCGAEIGIKILNSLNNNFIKTTDLGFGSGDEMLYLEVLDEFYNDIEKSYVSINNIVKKYLAFHYHKECYDCCKEVLAKDNIFSYSESHMNILFAYYISSFYYKNSESLEIIKQIYNVCKVNPIVNQMFDNNKGFYESQFKFVSGYDKLKLELEKEKLDYVKNKYHNLCYNKTNINEHLPTLYKYASDCESVFETGVGGVISSWAFSYGLLNNGKEKKQLFMNDKKYCNINELLKNTKNTTLKIDYEWVSNLQLEVKQNYDIIFIDTWHIYGQLKRELKKFSQFTNKYIIIHDTTVDEIYGETIRNGWNAEQQSIESGFPIEEITCGLWKAIEEFLVDNSEWKIKERYYNNNGLTILEKI
jgi:hypothetical protein